MKTNSVHIVQPGQTGERDTALVARRSWSDVRVIALALALLASCGILLWYWETSVSIVAIWYRSETFAHGFLVLPTIFYLIWYRRGELAQIPLRPFLPASLFLALAGFGWLVAQLASVLGGVQFMMVAMIPLAVWTLLGTRMLRALAFPLAFLFFAVPLGEFLLPTLMEWTADFTVAALKVSGIPVYRENLNFVIPTGTWSVEEACSGLRYLIASGFVGMLYASLNYRRLSRRLWFIAAALVVPLIANGLRAYMIVMIGHWSNNRLATGVDHIVYGWIFFGVVMVLLFWVGSFWREDDPARETKSLLAEPEVGIETTSASTGRFVVALVLVVAASAIWRPIWATIEAKNSVTAVMVPSLAPVHGWVASAAPLAWKPDFSDPRAELEQSFAKDGHQVSVYIAYYRDQKQDTELVNSHNQLVRTTNKAWTITASTHVETTVGAQAITVPVTELRSARDQIVVFKWYWVDGHITASDYMAKVYLALAKLSGHGDDSALITIFTPKTIAGEPGTEVLSGFAADMGASIQRALVAADAQ